MERGNNFAHTDLEIHGYQVKVTQVRTDNSDVITAVSILDDATEEEVSLVLSEAERDELVATLTVI